MFGKKAAQHLQRQGRYGDTMLAHINPREAAMLKASGGSGTRNPKTGLLEFYGGEYGGRDEGDRASAAAEGGMSGHGTNSSPGTGGRDEGDRGRAAAGFASGGTLGPGGFGRQSTANASAALNDFYNSGGGFGNTIGNAIAANFGFRERNPVTDPNWNGGPNANWGFDPAGLVGGIAGMAIGAPGLGLVSDLASGALGRPGEIAMGPSVFGGPDAPSANRPTGAFSSTPNPSAPGMAPSTPPGMDNGSDPLIAQVPGASNYLKKANRGGFMGYYG